MVKKVKARGEKVKEMVEKLNEMAEQYPDIVKYAGYKFSWMPLWCITLTCICTMFISGAISIVLGVWGDRYVYSEGPLSVLMLVALCCCVAIFALSVMGMVWGTAKMALFWRPFNDLTEAGPFESDLKELTEVYHRTHERIMAHLAESATDC